MTSLSVSLLSLVLLLFLWNRLKGKNNRPPSPPGALPLLGHVFQMSRDVWIPFTEWKHKYGDIIYLNMMGTPVIVLNSLKVATDLLDRRSAIYSDRPRDIVGGEMLSGNHLMVLSMCNERWRRIRRAARDVLSLSSVSKFQQIQCTEATLLLHDMLQSPDKWKEHFDRMTSSSMIGMIYGNPPIRSPDHPTIKGIEEYVVAMTEATAPGKHLTQIIPALEHLPQWMAPWKRAALEGHEKYTALFTRLHREGMVRTIGDEGIPSLTGMLEEKVQKDALVEKEAAWIGAALMTAGTETILTALGWILEALVAFPAVQQRAQKEMDDVVGRHRMPNFNDLPNLPYIRAIVQEAMRLYPPTPFGIPHCLTEDDIYQGYFLEKGSTVFTNVWAINRDPELYGPDADKFNPARFFDAEGNPKDPIADTKDENHLTYGFGRRICVGKAFSNNTLFITTAFMVWGMKMRPAKGLDGHEIIPNMDDYLNVGLVRHPAPFKCSLEPRFLDVMPILNTAMEMYGFNS